MGRKAQGIRSIIGRNKIDRWEVKNSIGNGEAKELNMHNPWTRSKGGIAEWMGGTGQRG